MRPSLNGRVLMAERMRGKHYEPPFENVVAVSMGAIASGCLLMLAGIGAADAMMAR